MLAPSTFPINVSKGASDRVLAAISALAITGVLMATAIIPACPALATNPIIMGGLA